MPAWWRFALGYPWASFNTLIGLLLALIYGARDFEWHRGVLTCVAKKARVIGKPGAQTWGWLIIYTDPRYRTEPWAAGLRIHEHEHVMQGFIGGPFFMATYGVLFLYFYLTAQADEEPGWKDDYHRNTFEERAYAEGATAEPDEWGYCY